MGENRTIFVLCFSQLVFRHRPACAATYTSSSTIKAVQSMKFVSACVLTLALFATLGDALPLLPAARDANQKKPRLPAEQAFKAANHTLLGGPDFKALSKTEGWLPNRACSGEKKTVSFTNDNAGCEYSCSEYFFNEGRGWSQGCCYHDDNKCYIARNEWADTLETIGC